MDMLTFKMAVAKSSGASQQYADQALTNAKAYADALGEALSAEDLDASTALEILLNAFRAHVWQFEDEAIVAETGTVTLTNTLDFPFNDSQASVALAYTQRDTNYVVIPEITSCIGNAGEVVVSGKQTNGFKMAFTGSASSVTVKYIVIGGLNA